MVIFDPIKQEEFDENGLIVGILNRLAFDCRETARDKGFDQDHITSLCLIHSEVSEAVEIFRKNPNLMSTKIPQHTAVAEELADVIIRTLDLAMSLEISNIGQVVVDKLSYNRTRPFKHGKLF